MKAPSRIRNFLKLPLCAFALASVASLGFAEGDEATPHGKSAEAGSKADEHSKGRGKNLVHNGRSAFRGNLRTSQHIYYEGDALNISLQFARGHDLLATGAAEAHVVIYLSDGTLMDVPVPADIGPSSRKFFRMESVDISALPQGQYQLGLILTVPEGDPAFLEDWYGGFRALLDTEAVYVSAAVLDGDDDGDGEWDGDEDGDGIDGEEDDEADDDDVDDDAGSDDSTDDDSSDDSTGDDSTVGDSTDDTTDAADDGTADDSTP
jgi:hypothetical protein